MPARAIARNPNVGMSFGFPYDDYIRGQNKNIDVVWRKLLATLLRKI
jgi:hypothetical protein